MNVTRITSTHAQKVPLLFFLLCLAMFGKGAKESCGTYPERVKEELLRSKLNVERRELERVFRKLGGLAASEDVKGAARDIGNIAVIEEDAAICARGHRLSCGACGARRGRGGAAADTPGARPWR